MKLYYAHSPEKEIPAQAYAAHIGGVHMLAARYAQLMGQYASCDKELLLGSADKASLFHDLGKLHRENQVELAKERTEKSLPVNHVDAGTAYFLHDDHLAGYSAVAIQAHHIGFPDFPTESNKGDLAFRDERIALSVNQELPALEKLHHRLVPSHIDFRAEKMTGNCSVFLRLLLSCIADADHTETGIYYRNYPANERTIPLRPAQRLVRLDEYAANLNQSSAANERNALRSEMYHVCRNAHVDMHISSCDSPVGSGKTLAVMAHLLKQAEKRKSRHIFVVLPFTNIIRQSVDAYRAALTLPGENADEIVAELHHRADFENEKARFLTALWRAPIIVTTAVALFETLASNSVGTLRRLHELPGSCIFVDESHAALPVKLLPLAWHWINVYAKEWSCYWVLASGSLSRFWTIPEIAGEDNTARIPEIVEEEVRSRLSAYERTRVLYKHDLCPKNTAELSEFISRFPGPRLVILNTIQSAAMLADCFAKKYGRECVEHLSTALIPNDRDITLEHVKKRLKNVKDTDWTLVATSCVEAGINISFRNGFRELGALVSLLQTAGRVNRENVYSDSEVWTFCIAEDGRLKINPGMKEAAAVLKKYFASNQIICPEMSTQSMRDEIKLYGSTDQSDKFLQNETVKKFRWIEKEFQVIDRHTCLTVVDNEVEKRILDKTINWRELQKVSVQVPKYKLEEVRAPVIVENIYRWNLEYNHFIGYMAGMVNKMNF